LLEEGLPGNAHVSIDVLASTAETLESNQILLESLL
jgi:hypothetical protein